MTKHNVARRPVAAAAAAATRKPLRSFLPAKFTWPPAAGRIGQFGGATSAQDARRAKKLSQTEEEEEAAAVDKAKIPFAR